VAARTGIPLAIAAVEDLVSAGMAVVELTDGSIAETLVAGSLLGFLSQKPDMMDDEQ